MLPEESTDIVLGCESASIEFAFGPVERDHFQICTRLQYFDKRFQDSRLFYGMDLSYFADSLAGLHANLTGSVRFTDWDGELVLCLSVFDRHRGGIAIGGQLIPAAFESQAISAANVIGRPIFGMHGGIRIAFEGLVTDQSYLPPVFQGFRRFIFERGISVQNPLEQSP